jgi:ADP-ribose pyrophosphatase YjhB (NUDIX family)
VTVNHGTPPYIRALRAKIGNALLVVPTAGAFVSDDEGRILLGRKSEGWWTNPGGVMEPFEAPADCAVRETFEETGLEIELTGLIGVFAGPDLRVTYENGDEAALVSTLFRARAIGGTLRPDGEEIVEARFLTREEIDAIELRPWGRRLIEYGLGDGAQQFTPPTWTP